MVLFLAFLLFTPCVLLCFSIYNICFLLIKKKKNSPFFPSARRLEKFGWQHLSISFGKFGKKGTVLSLKICLSPTIDFKILYLALFLLVLVS